MGIFGAGAISYYIFLFVAFLASFGFILSCSTFSLTLRNTQAVFASAAFNGLCHEWLTSSDK